MAYLYSVRASGSFSPLIQGTWADVWDYLAARASRVGSQARANQIDALHAAMAHADDDKECIWVGQKSKGIFFIACNWVSAVQPEVQPVVEPEAEPEATPPLFTITFVGSTTVWTDRAPRTRIITAMQCLGSTDDEIENFKLLADAIEAGRISQAVMTLGNSWKCYTLTECK